MILISSTKIEIIEVEIESLPWGGAEMLKNKLMNKIKM